MKTLVTKEKLENAQKGIDAVSYLDYDRIIDRVSDAYNDTKQILLLRFEKNARKISHYYKIIQVVDGKVSCINTTSLVNGLDITKSYRDSYNTKGVVA